MPGLQGDYKVSEVGKSVLPQKVQRIEAPDLSLEELKESNYNIGENTLIGDGSYERVYCATLRDYQPAKIKKLDVNNQPEEKIDFLTQVLCINIGLQMQEIVFKHLCYLVVLKHRS